MTTSGVNKERDDIVSRFTPPATATFAPSKKGARKFV
jgi:hypothetical protein